MFGYVVQAIDIPANAAKIDVLQHQLLQELVIGKFVLANEEDLQHYVYICEYESTHIGKIELSHLFFNFAEVVCEKNNPSTT